MIVYMGLDRRWYVRDMFCLIYHGKFKTKEEAYAFRNALRGKVHESICNSLLRW